MRQAPNRFREPMRHNLGVSFGLATTVAFWLSLAGIVYIFAGYPILIGFLSRLFPADDRRTGERPASISVLIAAGNEAHRLPKKLGSLLAANGAEQITEVVIGSDGSTDDTVSVLQSYDDERVRVVAFDERRGKSAVLADLIPELIGEIVILTDARQNVSEDAVRSLLDRFQDPQIGVVSGELVFRSEDASTAAEGVGFYWTYEKFLRKAEARFRSVPGATGALYAVRRSCLKAPPADAILDDVAIPMLAVEQGYRCVFEPGAVAYDAPSKSTGQESIRKRRTIAGVVQLVREHPRWMIPRVIWAKGNPIWWEFVSHKVARLAAPPLLVVTLFANVALATDSRFYAGLLICQVAFYLAAVFGTLSQTLGIRIRALAPMMMFVALNWTTVLALIDASRGRFQAAWKRAA